MIFTHLNRSKRADIMTMTVMMKMYLKFHQVMSTEDIERYYISYPDGDKKIDKKNFPFKPHKFTGNIER
jgi:hypothetical protein